MARSTEIKITNRTGYLLHYECETLINCQTTSVPDSLSNGDTGTINIRSTTDTSPHKGMLVYNTTVSPRNLPVDIKIIISWNYCPVKTIQNYSISSIPAGIISSTAADKDVNAASLSIKFENIHKAYDIVNWMKYLPNNISLSNITIPGTFSSAACKGGFSFEHQSLTIEEQLEQGIRFLDFGCRIKSNILKVCYGTTDMGTTFSNIVSVCESFLNVHKQECIVMLLHREGGAPIAGKVYEAVTRNEELWWLQDRIPTMREARGKIVLLRRYDASGMYAAGIDAFSDWVRDSESFWVNRGNIYVQNKYNINDSVASINAKWQNIEETLALANSDCDDKMYINITGGAAHIPPRTLATGDTNITGAGINERLYSKLYQSNNGKCGIVVMDFPEDPNIMLIPLIIAQNRFQL